MNGARGETRTLTPFGRWNLNPVRLPISPLARTRKDTLTVTYLMMLLILGGAGYIGSHVCKLLRSKGEKFLVLDNLSLGHRSAVEPHELIVGDLREKRTLEKVFSEHKFDAVMHFAAHSLVGESGQKPSEYWENNLVGVLGLLDTMREANVTQFVFSSTAAVYGEPTEVPIPEDHPKNPTSTYGATKWAVEMALAGYGKAYGLRSVALRYFNAAGSDPEGQLGEDHSPETHLIPAAILSATGKNPPMSVFGEDYPTRDGTCVRDYVHVNDLAEAHYLALQHLRSGGASEVFNLGSGEGFTVKEVIEAIEKVSGVPVPRSVGPRRAGDPAVLIASSDKIRKALGWSPAYQDLEEIVRHAWDWRQKFPDGYGD